MDKSAPNSFNKLDYMKMWRDIKYFSLVPLSFYIGQVLVTIALPGHILSLVDFIPSNATMILVVGYVGNQALSAIRKFRE